MRIFLPIFLAVALLAPGCGASPSSGPGPRQFPSPLLSQSPPPVDSLDPLGKVSGPPATMVPLTTAVISNSGSTHTTGYRILVSPDGTATYQTPTGSGSMKLPGNLATALFADLKAAGQLSALPVGQCAKSASFGTTTTVQLGGQTTPDLSCPGNAAAMVISQDVQQIVEALGMTTGPAPAGQANVSVMSY
ncbi:MAG: hypothetical protein KGR26_06255 [Cyanobacteria bacterium REEB65]|nr:hypothetical protein [Cyanobacteria bacterium REEB65]